jgi:endonuclease-3
MRKNERAIETIKRLKKKWPDAHCELHHEGPYQLLIATILSAQCTDERVNKVTPNLFKQYPDAMSMSKASQEDIEDIIRSTGFFKNKAKNILSASKDIQELYQGDIPQDMDQLVNLAGVGRKTANVVLGNAFNINDGVVVDTHVKRITNLLKLTKNQDPVKIEKDLMKLFPREDWTIVSHLLIFLGRRICIARRPQCDMCMLNDICPSAKLKNKK